MIIETHLKGLNNNPIKINKKKLPKSDNENLTPFYFTALFIGAKNSGKTWGLVKMIKNYEEYPIRDADGNKLPIREILFCPTASSEANPIYKTLKYLDSDDIVLQYSDDAIREKIDSIQEDKQAIEDYKAYLQAWKVYAKTEDIYKLTHDELLILHKFDFLEPEYIPKPKYMYPPVVFIILDDMIGSNECFKKGNCFISNLTIKHRHLGINLIYTSQNPRSIPNIIRNNVDIFCLYKFANSRMVLEKIYEEVSSFLTEEQFEALYNHAVSEPHNSLVIDTHPNTNRDNRLKKNFDIVLSFT